MAELRDEDFEWLQKATKTLGTDLDKVLGMLTVSFFSPFSLRYFWSLIFNSALPLCSQAKVKETYATG